jgi:ADP-heptose:LPS heptosyltransferase
VQLHGGGRYSNPFVRRLGARYTAGLQACDAPSLDFTLPYVRWHHEVLRYLEVVSLVGAEASMLEPVVEVTEADVIESYAAVPPQSQPLAVLHPAANDPGRWWSAEKFAAVGDALVDAGAVVAINGTAEEAPLASCVKNAMRSRALDLSGRISLCGLTGLLSRARLVVGNDSGPLHLAAALGCATVGIYWCGNFLNWAPLTRARHYCAVSWQLNCSVCGQQNLDTTCEHRVSFVDSVTVEEVATAALELFGTDARSSISHGPVC